MTVGECPGDSRLVASQTETASAVGCVLPTDWPITRHTAYTGACAMRQHASSSTRPVRRLRQLDLRYLLRNTCSQLLVG